MLARLGRGLMGICAVRRARMAKPAAAVALSACPNNVASAKNVILTPAAARRGAGPEDSAAMASVARQGRCATRACVWTSVDLAKSLAQPTTRYAAKDSVMLLGAVLRAIPGIPAPASVCLQIARATPRKTRLAMVPMVRLSAAGQARNAVQPMAPIQTIVVAHVKGGAVKHKHNFYNY